MIGFVFLWVSGRVPWGRRGLSPWRVALLRPAVREVPALRGLPGGPAQGPCRTEPSALPALAFPASMDILQLLLFSFISLAPYFCNLRGCFEFRSHVFQTFAEPLRERLVCPAIWARCPWCSWLPPVCPGWPFPRARCLREGRQCGTCGFSELGVK